MALFPFLLVGLLDLLQYEKTKQTQLFSPYLDEHDPQLHGHNSALQAYGCGVIVEESAISAERNEQGYFPA